MNDVEFKDWLRRQTDRKLKTIWNEIKDISGELPNMKDFFLWMFDDNGYLNRRIKKVETEAIGDFENNIHKELSNDFKHRFFYSFFNDYEKKVGGYRNIEKILINRIMATIIANRINLISNGRSGINEEKRKLYFKFWLHFSQEFNQKENQLPFRFIRQEYDITKPDSIDWRLEPPLASWDISKKRKVERAEKQLKDFFINTDPKTIKKIQQEFSDYDGKKMACLIWLLENKKIIKIDNTDKKSSSRIHFVRCLKNKPDLRTISAINKYWTSNNFNISTLTETTKGQGTPDETFLQVFETLKGVL